MKISQKMAYMFFGATLVLLGSWFAPVEWNHTDAQNASSPVFDEIATHRLRVVDENGNNAVQLLVAKDGGSLVIYNNAGKTAGRFSIDDHGGGLAIYDSTGKNVGQFSVANTGSGVLTTRDKFGHKTGNVP